VPLPKPEPGLVISYAYLWANRAAQGHEEAEKSRPCAIILSTADAAGATAVMVLPITHTPPNPGNAGIEIPAVTRKRIGLDEAPCWVMVSEVNRFIWPGPDLRPIPGSTDEFAYGLMPPRFFKTIRDSLLQRARQGQVTATTRTK
jgi:hypothetical protein